MSKEKDGVELMLSTAMQFTKDFEEGKPHWQLTDDVQNHTVSTVKLPINHGTEDAPLWYETMVFPKGTFIDVECERYETQEQAKKGHEEMVRKWSDMM